MTLDRRRIPKHIHSAAARPVHGGRCVTKSGDVGCDTTSWHKQVEMTDTVIDEINHDTKFDKFVQQLWKKHGQSIPRFLKLGARARTSSMPFTTWSHYEDLVVVTECTSTGPSWDPARSSSRASSVPCRLFSIVAFNWELTP